MTKSLKSATILGASLALLGATLGLLGYLPGLELLGRVQESFIPMAPSTAMLFLLQGLILLRLAFSPANRQLGTLILMVIAALTALFGLLEIPGQLTGLDLNFEDRLVPEAGKLGEIPIARMSSLTGALFFLTGMAIFLLLLRSYSLKDRSAHGAGILGSLAFFGSFVVTLGYMIGTPVLYGQGATVPIALTTAIAFLWLTLAIMAAAGQNSVPLQFFVGPSTQARLMRAFVPIATATILAESLAALYIPTLFQVNPVFIVSITVASTMVILGVIVSRVSGSIGHDIDETQGVLAKVPAEDPHPVMRIGTDGTVLFANSAARPLLEESDVGQAAPDYWKKLSADVLERGEVKKNVEIEHEGKILSFTGVPVPEGDYVNLYGLDVTERKKTEEEKGELLHAVGERVKELNCLYVIAKIAAVPDVSLDELCQKTAEIIPPSWQYPEITCARIIVHGQEYKTANFKKTKWLQAADITEYGNKAGTVEVYYLEERPVLYEGPFLKEERDLIEGIAERLGNFTERKQAESALIDSELRYRTLFEQSPDAVLIIDPQTGRATEFNEAAYQQLGYSDKEFANLTIDDYEVKETQEEIHAHIEHVLQRGRDVFETKHRTKGGEVKDILVSAQMIQLAERRVFLSIFRDITAQKKAKEFSDALNVINNDINSTLEFNEIMQAVVAESSKAIGCERGVIYIREDESWVSKHVYGFPPDLIGTRFSDTEAPFAAQAAKTRKPVVSHKATYDEHQKSELMSRYDVKSLLSVPLFSKEGIVGSLMFAYHGAEASFGKAEIDFAEKLSTSVALAIENSRLYGQEHTIADTLQETLLTVPEKIEGISFGHLYRSTTAEAAKAGGDFYDLFELEHENVGIVIGDVSGKGLAASTLTALVKSTIKAYAYEHKSPSEVITLTNNVVEKASAASMFVTVCFGVLDKQSGVFTYCSAGHPPVILRRRSGKTRVLETKNLVIGVFPDQKFIDDTETVETGDALVLYTDGLTEARRDKELFGEGRLVRMVKDIGGRQVNEVPRLILDGVEKFDKALADDVAILAVSLEEPNPQNVSTSPQQRSDKFLNAKTKKAVLESLALELIEQLDASGATIMLIDPEGEHLHGEVAKPDDLLPNFEKATISLSEPLCAPLSVSTKSPIIIDNAHEDPRSKTWLVRFYQAKSLLVVPIMDGDEALGSVSVIETKRFRHFDEDEVKVAQLLASKAGSALKQLEEAA